MTEPEIVHANGPAPTLSLGKRIAAIPAGHKSKFVVLALWIVAIFALGPLAGKLSDEEDNNSVQWLPASAESTTVNELLPEFPAGQTSPAVVVYYRDSGLTAEDQATVEADRQALAGLF